jgi:hypothetical protein
MKHRSRASTIALVAVASVLALAGSSVAAGRIGVGKMTVTPNRVTAGSVGNDLTLTFTADSARLVGQTVVNVPRGWTDPQRANGSAPGFVQLNGATCSGSTRITSITGRRITIATNCKRRHGFQLLYRDATAPQISADGYIFLTLTRSGRGRKAKLRPLGRAKQPVVRVRGGPAASLFMNVTSVATAGVPFSVTVRAIDAYGNNAAEYAGMVSLSSTDKAATLPAPYAYGPQDVAQHTFPGAILRTTGTQRITATDSLGHSVTSAPIMVSPFSSG